MRSILCLSCWNADKMAEKLRAGNNSCTGMDMPTMSIEELKSKVLEEWQKTRKTDFQIFHKAVPSATSKTISWTFSSPLENKKAKINIKFI